MDEARLCLERACLDVPPKQVCTALLEYAKYFEMIGENRRAIQIMLNTKDKAKNEWKIQFEAVMLYMRCGLFNEAEQIVKESLKTHFATGRLWAVLIQLYHSKSQSEADFDKIHETFEEAMKEIPKSGEVWCEGARLAMSQHPCNRWFDLDKALTYLEFAVQFTP